jgi:hypothetical protein
LFKNGRREGTREVIILPVQPAAASARDRDATRLSGAKAASARLPSMPAVQRRRNRRSVQKLAPSSPWQRSTLVQPSCNHVAGTMTTTRLARS